MADKRTCPARIAAVMIIMTLAALTSGAGAAGADAAPRAEKASLQMDAVFPATEPSDQGLLPRPTDESGLRPLSQDQALVPLPSNASPFVWDWRAFGGVSPVKDQRPYATCWAQASLAGLESLVMITEGVEYDFSEFNVVACTPFHRTCTNGGGSDYYTALQVFKAGAIEEACDPISQCENPLICNTGCPGVIAPLGWRYLANDVAEIKDAVRNIGPVYTTINGNSDQFKFLGPDEVYYNTSDAPVTHAVLIVGYNDKKKFPGGRGAWLVKNSWGTWWADGGFGWVAYGSANIGTNSSVYTEYEPWNPEEDLYFYDEWGRTSRTGTPAPGPDWGMMRFTPQNSGLLERVDFWTVDINAAYRIRVYDDLVSGVPQNLIAARDGLCDLKGYYSIPLASPPLLRADDDIYVAIEFTIRGETRPVPIDYLEPKETDRSFLSGNGTNFYPYPNDMAFRIRVTHNDQDADGMPDYWENAHPCMQPAVPDDLDDHDKDGLDNFFEFTNDLDPCNPDMDGEGLADGSEVMIYSTDPRNPDTDDDGITDNVEAITAACLDPLLPDTDGDGIMDGTSTGEDKNGNGVVDFGETDPCNPDTDGDGLQDGLELLVHNTDPLLPDTDGDGLEDGDEINVQGTDPLLPDTDGDGLADFLEAVAVACLDPLLPDTDGDGIMDGTSTGEDNNGNGVFELGETDPCNPDTDGDGLQDGLEVMVHNTDPLLPDTDNDGITDYIEAVVSSCLNPLLPDTDGDGIMDGTSTGEDKNGNGVVDFGETDPCSVNNDRDGDGVNDSDEINVHHTDPLKWDTDGDYLPDGFEIGHAGDALALDALNPADGGLDFDLDGNPNFHEYWNGTDPWSEDPEQDRFRSPGCYYWGDADGGGAFQANDRNMLEHAVPGFPIDYSRVIPPNGDTQDLDVDEALQANDLFILQCMIVGMASTNPPSRPELLLVEEAPGATVAAGSTCHVTVGVANRMAKFSAGFGVVFEIDEQASTGRATLLGGDGSRAAGTRYDISGPILEGGRSRVVLAVEQAGEIYLRARIPECVSDGEGRYCPEITLAAPVIIIAR